MSETTQQGGANEALQNAPRDALKICTAMMGEFHQSLSFPNKHNVVKKTTAAFLFFCRQTTFLRGFVVEED